VNFLRFGFGDKGVFPQKIGGQIGGGGIKNKTKSMDELRLVIAAEISSYVFFKLRLVRFLNPPI